MFWRKKKEPKPLLKFDMKVICEYGQGVSQFTYQTNTDSADKALGAIFTEYGGEKVVCISSRAEGRSIIFPREKLVYAEALFIDVVEEKK